jgi:hypothetical protein
MDRPAGIRYTKRGRSGPDPPEDGSAVKEELQKEVLTSIHTKERSMP